MTRSGLAQNTQAQQRECEVLQRHELGEFSPSLDDSAPELCGVNRSKVILFFSSGSQQAAGHLGSLFSFKLAFAFVLNSAGFNARVRACLRPALDRCGRPSEETELQIP